MHDPPHPPPLSATSLGELPTPLSRLSVPDGQRTVELWLKNDGVSSKLYGGNKVRKLRVVLEEALRRRARRVLTFGAAGSHHVLATTLFARRLGLQTAAILTPQPHTDHAAETLRAAMGAGLQAVPASSPLAIPLALARLRLAGDFVLGPGALGALGALSYLDAVSELVEQLTTENVAPPTHVVVAVGSGGTAAGLLAGVYARNLDTRIIGVCCGDTRGARALVLTQAALALRRSGIPVRPERLGAALQLDASQVGRGYGHPGPDSPNARRAAALTGLQLDQTYTEKALAVALRQAGRSDFQMQRNLGLGVGPRTLYWHTLSAAPMGPLLAGAPKLTELPATVRELLQNPPPAAADK